MNFGFWKKLKKPFFVLAPMANVTDFVFRQIIAKYGKPDVFWTEFVSADGLCSEGKKRLFLDLKFDKKQKPIVAQIFSSKPEKIFQAAKLIQDLGFDGVDINMGCPDRAIEKQGAGAALMKNPTLAQEIIIAAKEGARKLPVSIKTRIGYSQDVLEEWLGHLIKVQPSTITVHARTRKQMSKVPADWSAVKRAVDFIKKNCPVKTRPFVIGNGDALSLDDAKAKAKQSGADGVMLGRAIFGNPWLFGGLAKKRPNLRGAHDEAVYNKDEIATSLCSSQIRPVREILSVMLEHTKLYDKIYKGVKNFDNMKKHYKAYINNFEGARELRSKLMQTKNASEVEAVIKKWNLESRI